MTEIRHKILVIVINVFFSVRSLREILVVKQYSRGKRPYYTSIIMAYVHEIKFYSCNNGVLMVALYDNPTLFSSEFWIKNIDALELGFTNVPDGLRLEQKYKVEALGIKPFQASKPEFNFIDQCAKTAWHIARQQL